MVNNQHLHSATIHSKKHNLYSDVNCRPVNHAAPTKL